MGIVISDFNSKITEPMLEQALARAKELGVQVTYVCRVPGAFDMPIIIQDLLEKGDVDAVATLGAIVKGETGHDEVIAATLCDQIAALAVKFRKPVALGVSGPRENWAQAESRALEYANRSVESAIKLVRLRNNVIDREKTAHPVLTD